MNSRSHHFYIYSLVIITVVIAGILTVYGFDYYSVNLEERHNHIKHEILKPTGSVGHGIGITGSLLMIIGVFGYMARKRLRALSRIGILKHWLEFHIFLCTLGPILVLYHTSFKFGGLVAISFWSMIAVVFSGVIGRFIYLQIPRTIEGREMTRSEISKVKMELFEQFENKLVLDAQLVTYLNNALQVKSPESQGNFFKKIIPQLNYEKKLLNEIRQKLNRENISQKSQKSIIRIAKKEIILSRRIAWLSTMQDFLTYWHVAHLPFALVMLIIMIVHVIVAVVFGYTWLF